MKKCLECDKYKDSRCNEDTKAMDLTCLFRIFLWSSFANKDLLERMKKFMDKTEKEMDEGDDWKKD